MTKPPCSGLHRNCNTSTPGSLSKIASNAQSSPPNHLYMYVVAIGCREDRSFYKARGAAAGGGREGDDAQTKTERHRLEPAVWRSAKDVCFWRTGASTSTFLKRGTPDQRKNISLSTVIEAGSISGLSSLRQLFVRGKALFTPVAAFFRMLSVFQQ